MKSKLSVFLPAAMLLLIFTLLCGLAYPALVTGAAQLAMPEKANGSIIKAANESLGSFLLGQTFSDPKHLWGRPAVLAPMTLSDGSVAYYGKAENLSPAGDEFYAAVSRRISKIKSAHPEMGDTPIPLSLITGSGSGLDPHISTAAAEYQVKRLAENNGITQAQVRSIIEQCTDKKFLGIFGEETVNVLKVNLLLDGKIK